MDQDALFSDAGSIRSRRILYTPSPFARANLVHLQETGRLTATAAHTSRRERLQSFLCFVVCAGSGQLVYDGQHFPLKAGDVVFLDCRRPYAHSTGGSAGELWTLQWCHFYGPCVAAIYEKYCERGGRPVFHPADAGRFSELLSQVYAAAGNDDYIRDMWLNEKLNTLLALLMAESWQPASLRNPRRPARRDVAPVREYLEEHCTEKIALESVAEHFFLNKHYQHDDNPGNSNKHGLLVPTGFRKYLRGHRNKYSDTRDLKYQSNIHSYPSFPFSALAGINLFLLAPAQSKALRRQYVTKGLS